MKSWLHHDNMELYSAHNKGNSVAAERFIEPYRIQFINTRLQYQKLCILIN